MAKRINLSSLALLFLVTYLPWNIAMSESQVDAYFISDTFAQENIASKNPDVVTSVLKKSKDLLETYSPRFSGLTLEQAVDDLVNAKEQDNRPFHYSFALWAIINAQADSRPADPHIPYPFMDLYDFNEILEAQGSFKGLLSIFESLNNQVSNNFPYQLKAWGDIPGFAYLPRNISPSLKKEIQQLRNDIDNDKSWTIDIEEPEDLERILSWIEDAIAKDKNLVLIMEGDL